MAGEYPIFAAKRDPATGNIAMRTKFPEDQFPQLAWLVVTADACNPARTSEVEAWDDLPDWTPPAPPAPEGEV